MMTDRSVIIVTEKTEDGKPALMEGVPPLTGPGFLLALASRLIHKNGWESWGSLPLSFSVTVFGSSFLLCDYETETSHLALLFSSFGIPIMTSLLFSVKCLSRFFRKNRWQRYGEGTNLNGKRVWGWLLVWLLEKLLQMLVESFPCFDRKTGHQRINRCIDINILAHDLGDA